MKRLVFAVLGKFDYDTLNYTMDSRKYLEKIAAGVIAKHYREKGDDVSILLFCPVSLVTFLATDINNVSNLIQDHRRLKKEIKNVVEKKLGISPEIVIIPAIGKYPKIDKKTRKTIYSTNFNIKPSTIKSKILLSLIENSNNYDSFILDISIGHNIYVSILQDAFRDLIVNRKLKNIFRKDNFESKIADMPPKIGTGVGSEFPINLRDYDVKVFFDFPIKGEIPDIGNYVSYHIVKNNATIVSKIKDLNNIIKSYRLLFIAIKRNTPLVVMDNFLDLEKSNSSYLNTAVEIFSEIVKLTEKNTKIEIDSDEVKISYENIKADRMKNFFHACALSDSLNEMYERYIWRKEGTITNLNKIFIKNIYDKLKLDINSLFLHRDIKEISNMGKRINKDWKSLKEIFEQERCIPTSKDTYLPNGTSSERNFFAHSGLVREFVCVKKENNEIYIKYRKKYKGEDVRNTIINWLKSKNNQH